MNFSWNFIEICNLIWNSVATFPGFHRDFRQFLQKFSIFLIFSCNFFRNASGGFFKSFSAKLFRNSCGKCSDISSQTPSTCSSEIRYFHYELNWQFLKEFQRQFLQEFPREFFQEFLYVLLDANRILHLSYQRIVQHFIRPIF